MKTIKFKIGPITLDLTKKELGKYCNLFQFVRPIGYKCRLCNRFLATERGINSHLNKQHWEFIVEDILGKEIVRDILGNENA